MEQQHAPMKFSAAVAAADQLQRAAASSERTAAPGEGGASASVATQGAAADPAALDSSSTGAAQSPGRLTTPAAARHDSPQPPSAGAARLSLASSGRNQQQPQAPRGPASDTTKAGGERPPTAGQQPARGIKLPAAQQTNAAAAAGQCSNAPQLASNSSGSWPGLEGDALLRASHSLLQQPEPRSSGVAGMLWLGGTNGGSTTSTRKDQAGRGLRPPSPVLPGGELQETQGSGRSIPASPGGQQALPQRQQLQQDARSMPPPPARGSSPDGAPPAAAAAGAADDDRPASQRPPPLEIPASGSMGSQQQAHTQVLQQQQQQQHVAQPVSARLERPGSAPQPSTAVTPSLLHMGLSDGAACSAGAACGSSGGSGSRQRRQHRVPQGAPTRRGDAQQGSGGGNDGQQQQQQPGLVFSPLSSYPLASPGQRRRRSEQGGRCDGEQQLPQRPASADVPSGGGRAAAAAAGGGVDDDEQQQQLAAKRPKSSLGAAGPRSHARAQQQQQQPLLPAGFVPAGPGGAGLSISPAGPLSGLAWQQPAPGFVSAAAQQTPPAAVITEMRGSGGARVSSLGSGGMVPVQQQQQRTVSSHYQEQQVVGGSSLHALQQERPVVLSLTPPNQLTAALQRPDSSGRQPRRTHASSSPARAAARSADAPQKQQQAADGDAAQEALFSSAGRPLRQQSSRRNAATAAAERYERLDRDTGPVSYAGGLRYLQVWCDQLPGNLDLQRMLVIPQAGEREGHPMSLSQFEILGGRGSARKWRRSVSVDDAGLAISLGEWLEKYAEGPGGASGVAAAGYKRASGKPRGASCTPPAAAGAAGRCASRHDQGTARADADAAAAAAPLCAQAPTLLGSLPLQQQQPAKPLRLRGASGGLAAVPSPGAAAPSLQPSGQEAGRGSPILAGLTAPHPGAQLRARQHPAARAAAAHGPGELAGAAELSLSVPGSAAAAAAAVSHGDIWSFCLLPDMAPDGAAHMELQLHAGHVDDLADAGVHHEHQHLLLLGSPTGANLLASPLTLQLEAAAASETPRAPPVAGQQE